MKAAFIKLLEVCLKVVMLLTGIILAYLLAIIGLGFLPVNKSFAQTVGGIEIFVIDNGVHTDLVLPVTNRVIDWRTHLHLKDFSGADTTFTHFAFGWGNRRFYMETPDWNDLNLEIALSAAFGFGRSAMHVYYLPNAPVTGSKVVSIKLSAEEYAKLVDYILGSFQQQNGSFLLIKGKGYRPTDNFYEANGKFSMFKTCNCWVNSGLKKAGIKTVFWAPFPHLMMHRLRKLT